MPPTTKADTTRPFSRQRAMACSGTADFDSAYVVRVAAEAFAGPAGLEVLQPLEYQAVVSKYGTEEGLLVRLVPRASQAGGGGLAYVDAESGCAIALKSYE